MKTRNCETLLEAGLAWRQPPSSGTTLRQPPIPGLAFSGLATSGDQERSQSGGCNAYIVRPLGYKELYVVMERHLPEPKQVDEQATPPTRSPA